MKILIKFIACGVILVSQSQYATAAIETFFGVDYGASPGTPRPDSNAAASAFDSSSPAVGRIDFEDLPVGSFTTLALGQGVSATYVRFQSDIRPAISNDIGSPRGGFNTTGIGKNFIQLGGNAVTFRFSKPITGFGAFITGLNPNGALLQFNDGAPAAVNIGSLFYPGIFGGSAFVGFVSNGTPFDSVTLRTTSTLGVEDWIGVDDLRYVNAVPEPTTLALLCAGLIVVTTLSSRAKNRSTI